MKSILKPWITLWLLLGVSSFAADSEKSPIVVFAAASLTNVLQELGDHFTKETSDTCEILVRGQLSTRFTPN